MIITNVVLKTPIDERLKAALKASSDSSKIELFLSCNEKNYNPHLNGSLDQATIIQILSNSFLATMHIFGVLRISSKSVHRVANITFLQKFQINC